MSTCELVKSIIGLLGFTGYFVLISLFFFVLKNYTQNQINCMVETFFGLIHKLLTPQRNNLLFLNAKCFIAPLLVYSSITFSHSPSLPSSLPPFPLPSLSPLSSLRLRLILQKVNWNKLLYYTTSLPRKFYSIRIPSVLVHFQNNSLNQLL